jgi:hypothetical protein
MVDKEELRLAQSNSEAYVQGINYGSKVVEDVVAKVGEGHIRLLDTNELLAAANINYIKPELEANRLTQGNWAAMLYGAKAAINEASNKLEGDHL